MPLGVNMNIEKVKFNKTEFINNLIVNNKLLTQIIDDQLTEIERLKKSE